MIKVDNKKKKKKELFKGKYEKLQEEKRNYMGFG